MSVKSFDLGKVARSMDLLGGAGVTNAHLQETINNPIRRATVAAAYKGDTASPVSIEDILNREIIMTGIIQYAKDQTMVNGKEIERALRKLEATNGAVTLNDRFIPEGLTLDSLFQFIYRWNAERASAGETLLKLYNEQDKEWWRTNKDVESLPTKAAILTCDFNTVMRATDLAGRPFNLNMDEQVAWSKEQGGDGIMSAEEVVYLFVRSLIENQLPLWGGGSVRCKNAYGSDDSLGVRFCADDGFSVDDWRRSDQSWSLGALPGKSLVLES